MIDERLLRDGHITVALPQESVAWAEAVIPTLETAQRIELLQIWWKGASTQSVLQELPTDLRGRLTDAYNAACIRIRRQAA